MAHQTSCSGPSRAACTCAAIRSKETFASIPRILDLERHRCASTSRRPAQPRRSSRKPSRRPLSVASKETFASAPFMRVGGPPLCALRGFGPRHVEDRRLLLGRRWHRGKHQVSATMALGLPTQAGLCHHGCEGLPWRAPGGVADRTSVIEGDWREESGPGTRCRRGSRWPASTRRVDWPSAEFIGA